MSAPESSADPLRPTVSAIHVAPATRLALRSLAAVRAEAGKGLAGDRYHGTRHRHVTVQSQSALDDAGADLGAPVEPAGTRRNVTISHGEVPYAPGARIRIGDVVLEVVRRAAPCKLLDDSIGPGARDALVRRAGSVFRVLTSGTIAVGDPVDLDADRDRSGRGRDARAALVSPRAGGARRTPPSTSWHPPSHRGCPPSA